MKLPHRNQRLRLRDDERGNVAMIFAMTAVVSVGVVGGAVDFGRVFAAKSAMQATLDAAVLAGGSKYAESGDMGAARTLATTYFQERYGANSGGSTAVPTMEFLSTSALISAQATVEVPTPFLSMIAGDKVLVTVDSSISLGGKKLELALMFDVTGSMSEYTSTGNTKLVSAKEAAKDLIDIVMPSTGVMSSRMSLVPFSQAVKLDLDTAISVTGGTATRQAPYQATVQKTTYTLDTSNTSWRSLSSCTSFLSTNYYQKLGQGTSTANSNADAYCRTLRTRVRNGTTQYDTPTVDSSTQNVQETRYRTEYLRPCVVERATSSSTLKYGDSAPVQNEWPATYSTTTTSNVSCPPTGSNGAGTLIPLTTSRTTLINAIDALQASGGTAGQIGTAWAWYTISPNWGSIWEVDSRPAETDPRTVMKVAVLMTDGEYNSCGGSSTSCSTSASQAAQLCTKMKEAGVDVYTIGFGMSTNVNDPARQTLVNCASPGKYYFPYNGDEIRAAFRDIGAAIVAGGAGPRLLSADQVQSIQ